MLSNFSGINNSNLFIKMFLKISFIKRKRNGILALLFYVAIIKLILKPDKYITRNKTTSQYSLITQAQKPTRKYQQTDLSKTEKF